MHRFIGVPILTGRLKMFYQLLIMVFVSSLCWTPAVSRVLHKRGASFYIANETMCIVDGDVYHNGDPVPTDDECERCTCRPPGFSCVLRDCDNKPGCKAVRRVGECCPEYVCGCVHNSRLYEDGELIKDLQNNCYTCRCHGSSISCTFADCGFRSDCPPEYIPGECCPRYDHCPPAVPRPSTTTTTASPTLIQQEIDFFNLTTHHVQKFTTESTVVKVEEITTSDLTTATPGYTVKFTIKGEKISSIHDFDDSELTTLLPLHPVTYKETTRHVMVPEGTELTTLKDGLIIASFDKMTESASTFELESETETVFPLQTTTDASTSTDYTSSKESFTDKNAITVLSEDVSDWDDGVKTQEAEPSTSESDSEENNIDFSEAELVTDEISQQESSRATTEVPISNHTLISTLDHTYQIVHEDISTTEHSEIASHEKTDFKSTTDFLATTTIDDETVTRKVTESFGDKEQSSLDELHGIITSSSIKPEESTGSSLETFDKLSTHTKTDNDFSTSTAKYSDSSTDEIPHFDAEGQIDTISKSTTSDDLIISTDNTEKTTELYHTGEKFNISSFAEDFPASEIPSVQGSDVTSHSSDDVSDEASTSSLASSEADQIFSTHQTVVEKEISGDNQLTDNEYKSSVDDSLVSTDHDRESTSAGISTTSSSEHINILDAETTAYPEHDKATDLSSKASVDLEKEITTKNFEDVHIYSTLYSVNDSVHEKYDTTTEIYKTGYDTTKEIPNVFEIDASLNKTDFDLISVGEDEETEAESEEVTTEFLPGKTSSDHSTHEDALNPEDAKINVYTGQTNEDTTTFKTTVSAENERNSNTTGVDYDANHDVSNTEHSSMESTTSTDISLPNATHVLTDEKYSVTEITNYTTEHLTDSFRVTEPGAKENVSQQFISKTDSSIDDLITTTKTDESASQSPNTSEILSGTTKSQTVIYDKNEEIIPVKLHEKVSEVNTHTSEFVETTFKTHTTEKTTTTTEDDMPNELPAFEPPLANILKQHMFFNRPVTQTVPSTTQVNPSKDASDENQIEKLSLSVDETDLNEPPPANILKQHMFFNRPVTQTVPSTTQVNPSKDASDENQIEKLSLSVDETDSNESENKIIVLNQEYTIQDSEILSATPKSNNESPNSHDENRDNLYFVKTEDYSVTQASNKEQTSTEIIYNVQSTPTAEDLSHSQNYEGNEESNIDIMDSEEVHNEMISEESTGEDVLTLAPTQSPKTPTHTETTISGDSNTETSTTPQVGSHIVSDANSDSEIEKAETESIEFFDHSTTKQNHLNENFELDTKADGIVSHDDLDSDFVYEDAESSENVNDRTVIQAHTTIEELQTHLISPQEDAVSSSLSDRDESSTESRPVSSHINYTSITSDAAKEDYLAALKFSTLYEQKFFTTPQQYQTFESASTVMQNVLNSTKDSEIYEVGNKGTTSDTSESIMKEQQTHDYNEASKSGSELDLSMTVTSNESENLSVFKEHSTTLLNSFNTLFSTLNFDSFTTQDGAAFTTQSNIESVVDRSELNSSSSETKISNLTKSSVQDYSSRLKNEFAEYGVLGGTFITGKSKYKVNITDDHDKGSNIENHPVFSHPVVEPGANLALENKNISFHNHSDDLELENEAEADYSTTNSESKISYTTTAPLKHGEKIGADNDEIKNEEPESTEKEISAILSTKIPSDETKLEETSGVISDETLTTTAITEEMSEVLSTIHSNFERNEDNSFSTKEEVQQEKGPEKGGDWFEPTDPNLDLPRIANQKNVSNTMSQLDHSYVVPDASTVSSAEHGPEKGGDWFEPTEPHIILESITKRENLSDTTSESENASIVHNAESNIEQGPEKGGDVFEPTFPDLFPINNANPAIERNTTNSTTNVTDLTSEESLNQDFISTTSTVTESKTDLVTTTENNIKVDFVPPLPILLKSFTQFTQNSNNSKNGFVNQETINDDEISTFDLNQDYMSDEGNVELPPKRPSERNLDTSYDLSDVISKVFKSPGYDREVHLSSLKDYSDLMKSQSLGLDAYTHSKTSDNIHKNAESNNKPASERHLNPSYDMSGIISKVFKAPGYDTEVHLMYSEDISDLKKRQHLRLRRNADIQSVSSENIQPRSEPNNDLRASSNENVHLFANKNILLVEGYGQKPSGFVPVTSSLIIVHSDDENEAEVDSEQNKSGNESKDVSVSESVDEAMSIISEKDDPSASLSKQNPKV